MRQGLLGGAPACLKSALECLEPAEAPSGCRIDKERVAAVGLGPKDLKSAAMFLASVSSKGEGPLVRVLVKLLGPEWDSRFSGEGSDGRSLAELFVARAALAMLMADGKKLGVIGGQT